MSKARVVITAVVFEGRSQSEVARAYGVSQSWVSRLVGRYRAEGEAAFEPRSRRPVRSPSATTPEVVELVLRLRKELAGQGLDAGAHTICWHLQQHHQISVSAATVWRVLSRHGQIVPEPNKRPHSSYIRFEAELPNQMWQTDFTHYRLRTGQDVEILSFLDDHSRSLLACVAFPESPATAWSPSSATPSPPTASRSACCRTTAWCSPPASRAVETGATRATGSRPNSPAMVSSRRT